MFSDIIEMHLVNKSVAILRWEWVASRTTGLSCCTETSGSWMSWCWWHCLNSWSMGSRQYGTSFPPQQRSEAGAHHAQRDFKLQNCLKSSPCPQGPAAGRAWGCGAGSHRCSSGLGRDRQQPKPSNPKGRVRVFLLPFSVWYLYFYFVWFPWTFKKCTCLLWGKLLPKLFFTL